MKSYPAEHDIPNVFRKAADLIDKHGLYRGSGQEYHNDTRCALTAINDVIGFETKRGGVDDPFSVLMYGLGFSDPTEVYDWNDKSAPGEVQATLRWVADKMEQRVLEFETVNV